MKKPWNKWTPTVTTGQAMQSGGPTRLVTLTQHAAVRVFSRSGRIRRKAANIGQIADYVSWLHGTFGDVRHVPTREDLWEVMLTCVGTAPVRGVEFGVAWGYGTSWWLTHITDPRLHWDGFDRFTGLPRSWRDMKEGFFDAGGMPPAIADDRVTWHVGDLEDTIRQLSFDRTEPSQLIILFDLDIYEPSAVAWQHIADSLQAGDVIYFDEAFDADERRLLNETVLPSGKFELLGASPMALALRKRS